MSRKLPTCNGEAIPQVELTYKKNGCIRGASVMSLTTPQAIAAWMNNLFGCRPQERVYALYLNARNEPLGVQLVSQGGITGTTVDQRVVFGMAMMLGASALILVHNHPSGDPAPSATDDHLTQQIFEGAKLLGVQLLDHLVIARGGAWTSYRNTGRAPFAGAVADTY